MSVCICVFRIISILIDFVVIVILLLQIIIVHN